MADKKEKRIRCSFCHKTEDQVRKLIAGPDGAFICDECIGICAEIMDEEHVDLINAGIKVYTDKYNSNFVSVPRYINQGIKHGEMIVSAVSIKHVKQKLKSKDNK